MIVVKGKATHSKATLSSILSRAFALGLIDDNPAQRRFVMPKTAARKRSADKYTQDELDVIFKDCRGEIWEPAFILAAFGGASREKAMSPLLDEITFLNSFAVIPIVRGVQRVSREVIVTEKPKNKYRERTLLIRPPYSFRLKEIADEYKERGYKWLMDDGLGGVLCPNRMADGAYKRWFLDKPHRYVLFGNLRKSCGTALSAAGMDGLAISDMLGHNQLNTTYAHYDQMSIEQKMGLIMRVMGNYGQSENYSEVMGNSDDEK